MDTSIVQNSIDLMRRKHMLQASKCKTHLFMNELTLMKNEAITIKDA